MAIDAIPVADCTDADGNAITTDQRGVIRPQDNACDIGAFEFEGGVDATTLNRKVIFGYQGWFGCPEDGSPPNRWIHWFRNNTPDAANATVDYWPDISELASDEHCVTDMTMPDGNGSPAVVFSNYRKKTVHRHFQWMKEYDIDGVFLQRFASELNDPEWCLGCEEFRDQVALNVQTGAEEHGRVFAVMYDISGYDRDRLVEEIIEDWTHLVDTLRIRESPRYLRHNGRPILAIWGLGFTHTQATPEQAMALIKYFKNVDGTTPSKYQATLVGGVPTCWRLVGAPCPNRADDTQNQGEWEEVYRSLDVISPWAVGRYPNEAEADNFKETLIAPDMEEASANGMGYMPVVFPGFSFHNGSLFGDEVKECNEIPREGGKFYWKQVFNALDAGADMLYVAMFDEVDEGTAMFKLAPTLEQLPAKSNGDSIENKKCADSLPPGEAAFVPLNIDGYRLPSDWYLRLGGETGRMMRGETALTDQLPIFPLFGRVFANTGDPANTLQGAFVQVCGPTSCQVTLTDASGRYSIPGLPTGQYTLRAFPPPGANVLPDTIGPVDLSFEDAQTGVDIVLPGPTPPPPGTNITSHSIAEGGIPVVFWGEPLTLTTEACPGRVATYEIILSGVVIRSGGMTEGPSGTYTATIDPLHPNHGNARLVITILCPDSSPEDDSFDIYIDPSGVVADQNGDPIAGATVTLFRSDSSAGPFEQVHDGSAVMSPSNRSNPDVTDTWGAFGWDVVAGYYKVRAEAADCGFGESSVLTIPPPVTVLELVLNCEPLSLGADSTFTLHQDPSDGATGLKVDITRVFDTHGGDGVNVHIESFEAGLTYLDAAANPAVPSGSLCVELLNSPREMDFPITNSTIDNAAGAATFEGSGAIGVAWPADLGHFLTRLNGSANQKCRVDLEVTSVTDTDGNPVTVPPRLTQLVQRGDARADGNVTIDDALFIAQYLLGSREACTTVVDTTCLHSVNAASVQQDGAFDQIMIADALFIAQYLAGLRDEFYNLVP